MEQYNSLGYKPPIKRHVVLMQAGADTRLRGFIVGPFSIREVRNVPEVGLYVAPLKDPILLG